MTALVLGIGCGEPAAGEPTPSDEPAPTGERTAPTLLSLENLPQPTPSFRRGLNLGNRLDEPREGERLGLFLHASDFPQIAEHGFDHVRLPVKLSGHAARTAPYAIDAAFIERVDWAVEQALLAGLSIVIDLHHYDEIFISAEQERERFLGIWRELAEHYAGFPSAVAFELLNEPHDDLTAALWNELAAEALAIVRRQHPTRTVIIDGPGWADPSALGEFEPPRDPNVLASPHIYRPQLFNFQGLAMGPDWATVGIVFPGPPATPLEPAPGAAEWVVAWIQDYNTLPADENPCGPATINAVFSEIDDFMARTGMPVYVGEFGIGGVVDFASHVAWLGAVRAGLDARNLGWSAWEQGELDQVFNGLTLEWNEALVDVLIDR